jgi:3-hydroxybutyryl-CoA dehydratase
MQFEDIVVGERANFTKTINESDLYLFCGISGDFNPLHVDELYAYKSLFKGRVVHGLLVASLLSNVLGMQLPGNGTIYISQTLNFISPVYIGDTITANVQVLEIIESKHHLLLRTWCVNQDDECVLDGEAKVLFQPGLSR